VYFDTDDQKPYIWNGTAWVLFASNITDSTSTTSSTTAASATAVKSAYDLANAAIPKSTVTTAGDVIYGTGSSAVARLGIGTAGQVLTVNSGATAPQWSTPAASGGGIAATLEDATTSLTLTTSHLNDFIRMTSSSANSVVVGTGLNTLADGSMIHIQQAGTGKTTITASGTTVTGTPTLGLRARYSAATLIKIGGTGTNVWTLIGDLSA
jgi:hypothetical protein